MLRFTSSLVLFLMTATISHSQVFETTVNTYFSGNNLSLEPTEDSGYIVFNGSQYSSLDMVKFDSAGNVAWARSYSESGMDKAVKLGKNRFAVYGNYTINYWPYQITSALHMIDSSGILEYNYLIPESLIIKQVHPTRDGGTIAITDPYNGNPTKIFKTDSLGILEWTKSIDSIWMGYYRTHLVDIINSTGNGFIGIGNYQYPDTNGSPWYTILIRLDSLGDTLWTKSYSLSGWSLKIINASPNSYLIYESNKIVLIDSSGQVIWSKFTVDTISGTNFNLMDCKLSADSNFVFTASYYNITHQSPVACIFKVDTNGVVKWARSYMDLSAGNNNIPLTNTENNGFAFAYLDQSTQNCTLVKTDSLGLSTCDSSLATPVFADSVFINPTPTFYGIHPFNLQYIDTLGNPAAPGSPAFTQADYCLLMRDKQIFSAEYSISISPNPAITEFTVMSSKFDGTCTVEIFNSLGEKIYLAQYHELITVNCELFPKGIYIVRLSNAQTAFTRKLIID